MSMSCEHIDLQSIKIRILFQILICRPQNFLVSRSPTRKVMICQFMCLELSRCVVLMTEERHATTLILHPLLLLSRKKRWGSFRYYASQQKNCSKHSSKRCSLDLFFRWTISWGYSLRLYLESWWLITLKKAIRIAKT